MGGVGLRASSFLGFKVSGLGIGTFRPSKVQGCGVSELGQFLAMLPSEDRVGAVGFRGCLGLRVQGEPRESKGKIRSCC